MKPPFDIASLRISLGKIGGLAPIIVDFTHIRCRTAELDEETLLKICDLAKTYGAEYCISAEKGDVVINFYAK